MNRNRFWIVWVIILLSMVVSSCSEKKIGNESANQCVGSFTNFAYKTGFQDGAEGQYLGEPINLAWGYEALIPKEVRNNSLMEHKIYGELIIGDNQELWIKSTYGNNSFFMADWMLPENKISIYNVSRQEWKTISAIVYDCNCIADELFFDRYGNVWAKNASSIKSEKSEKLPYLSKFDFGLNAFKSVDNTLDLFSGSMGEISEQMYFSHTIYDGIDNIWIFTPDGRIFKYNIPIGKITSIDTNKELITNSVTYNEEQNIFYLRNQKSDELNIIGINRDYEVLQFNPADNSLIEIGNIPFYLPDIPNLWSDEQGDLWFDSFGYLDTNGEWVLLIPNYLDFLSDRYYKQNYRYDLKSIIAETSDGKIWFYGNEGIAWYNLNENIGCWDSKQGLNIFQDSNNEIWLVTKDSLYKRE